MSRRASSTRSGAGATTPRRKRTWGDCWRPGAAPDARWSSSSTTLSTKRALCIPIHPATRSRPPSVPGRTNLGFETFIVSDATAAFELRGPDGRMVPPEVVHSVELAALNEEFATVVDSAELLESAGS